MQQAINRTGRAYIATLAAAVRQLWTQACEHDGIPPESKFVVPDKDNPYWPYYDKALSLYYQAKADYAAGGYVGLTIKRR